MEREGLPPRWFKIIKEVSMLILKFSGKAKGVFQDIKNLARLSPQLTIGDIQSNKERRINNDKA